MLRVAIWYENRLGRNDGNPLYVWNCLKQLQKEGQLEVDHLIPHGDLRPFGTYDLHIWVDWGEDALTGLLPYKPIFPPGLPLIYWASDTHLGYDHRLKCAKEASLVYCAQEEGVLNMIADGVEHVKWLPHGVEPAAYPKLNLAAKKYDLCFVGHVNTANRLDALDRLFKEFPNFFYGQRLFEEAGRKFSESKVVFNYSCKDDINMRTFEVLGTQSFLLTNEIPTINKLFTSGRHLVTFKDDKDMIAKAHYYLQHEAERERIARQGYQEVMKKHTLMHRVKTMLKDAKAMGLIKEVVTC